MNHVKQQFSTVRGEKIVSIDDTPKKSTSSDGNWVVWYETARPVGWGKGTISQTKSFWRKKEAEEWIASVKKTLNLVLREGDIRKMATSKEFNIEEARHIGDMIGVDWAKVDIEQFLQGLTVELEHGSVDPQTDITHDAPEKTGKIVLAHLKEIPDYYIRLAKMEEEAKGNHFNAGHISD